MPTSRLTIFSVFRPNGLGKQIAKTVPPIQEVWDEGLYHAWLGSCAICRVLNLCGRIHSHLQEIAGQRKELQILTPDP